MRIDIREEPQARLDHTRRLRNFLRFLPARYFFKSCCDTSDILCRGCQIFVIHPCWIGSVFLSLGLGFGVAPVIALGGMLLGISAVGGCVACIFFKYYNEDIQDSRMQLEGISDEQKKFISEAKSIGLHLQSGQTYSQVCKQLDQQIMRLEQEPKILSIFKKLDEEKIGVSKASGERLFAPNITLQPIILSYFFAPEDEKPNDPQEAILPLEPAEVVLNRLMPTV